MAKRLTPADELFWDCAAALFADSDVHESTMFGFRCVRHRSAFVGMPADNRLWVKLPADRVHELIESGVGEECAPNGRRFREWVKVPELNESLWLGLLQESIEFVSAPTAR